MPARVATCVHSFMRCHVSRPGPISVAFPAVLHSSLSTMKTRECKRCGEVGHFVKDCSSRNKPLKGYVAIDPSTQQMACNFCGLPGCYDRGERCPERLALKPDTVKNQPPGILDVLAQPHRQVCHACMRVGNAVREISCAYVEGRRRRAKDRPKGSSGSERQNSTVPKVEQCLRSGARPAILSFA